MSTHKNIDRICVVITALCLLLTVLFMNGERLGIEVVRDADAESYAGTEWFTANDLNGEWDDASATVITLQGADAKISGGGAYAYDGGVVISGGGRYVLSGTLTDGSITVDANDSAKVWIRLDGVDVACSDDACLRIDQADKVFLTLGAGTENSFSSGAVYSGRALADKTGGTIFAHDDLTINGSGSLSIVAQYKHGIDANDTLVVAGGRITVSAPADGVHVNDSFRFTSADLTVSAGDDAIHCDNAVCIAGGNILAERCYEGVEALTIDVTGGDITIFPTDDGLNANGRGGSGFGIRPGQTDAAADAEETWIRISGGTLTVVNENARDADGMDSNGDIYIDGGTIRISVSGDRSNNAIDFGSESGGVCIVTGGELIACGGATMTEGFSAESTQCAVLFTLEAAAAAGTPFRVLDAEGSEILSDTPACSYSSVAFSAAALRIGKTYTVCIGDETYEMTPGSFAEEIGAAGGAGAGGWFGRPGRGGDAVDGMPFSGNDADASPGGGVGGRGGERPSRPDGGGFPSGEAGTPAFPGAGSGAPGNRGYGGTEPERGGPQFRNNGSPAAPPDAAGESADGTNGAVSADAWILLGFSAVVLLIGLWTAVRYRRRG